MVIFRFSSTSTCACRISICSFSIYRCHCQDLARVRISQATLILCDPILQSAHIVHHRSELADKFVGIDRVEWRRTRFSWWGTCNDTLCKALPARAPA